MIKKFFKEAHALAWTVSGTLLVLITLSGDTQKLAVRISIITLVVHLLGVLFSRDSEQLITAYNLLGKID